MNSARAKAASAGTTQEAALVVGGEPTTHDENEIYNGTSGLNQVI